MGTVVQVVAVFQWRFVPFLFRDGRQYVRQFGLHVVPGQVDTGMILQIPVYARGNADRVVTSDYDLFPFLVEFEEVGIRFHVFDGKLAGGTCVDAFQQAFDGSSSPAGQCQKEQPDQCKCQFLHKTFCFSGLYVEE